MKAVQLLVNSRLPEMYRDYSRNYTVKDVKAFLSDLAVEDPDSFDSTVRGIADAGRNASYWQGETIGLDDLTPRVDKVSVFKEMDEELKQLNPDDPRFKQKRSEIWMRYNDRLQKMTEETYQGTGNSVADAILSGARGKNAQLKMMLTTPGLYSGPGGDVVPLFIRNSFSEGLRPAEALASTYGARSAVSSTKKATAQGGDMLKQMVQASVSTVVTEDTCGTDNGIDLPIDDESLQGRVLARGVGDLPAGTVLDRASMKTLEKSGAKNVIVRSPMTCQADDGVCAKCVGKFFDRKFPKIGDAVGMTASMALAEPITQGALNCLAEGTTVRMADLSTREIQDIRVGEWVLGSDIQGNTFPVQVLNVWDQGVQPVQTYTYKQGQTKLTRQVTATECHPILQNKKLYAAIYKTDDKPNYQHPDNYKAQKLPAGVKGKDVAAVLPVSSKCLEGSDPEPMALLYGCLLGDGIRWVADRQQSLRISCADQSMVDDMNTYLEPWGYHLVKRKRSHDWAVVHRELTAFTQQDPLTGRFLKGTSTHFLTDKLGDWGLDSKYAHDKTVLPGALTWKYESVCELLAGYIATDGSIYKAEGGGYGVSFGSCSKELLEGLRELLQLRLCVYPGATTVTGKAGEGNRVHDMYNFYVTRQDQVLKLLEQVERFIPGVKGPRAREVIQDLQGTDMRFSEPFYRCKRSNVEPVGMQQCWDLSVDHPDELFVLANGLIVKNTKHTGGAAKGKREFAGMKYLAQFIQSPEDFSDRAAVSEVDGVVRSIEEAPQGGYVVQVDDQEHYVPQGFEVRVKQGDTVEAGDQLSEGLVDAMDIVRLRGLGEGRRYYAERLHKMLGDSGFAAKRQNVELLARGAINHVRIEDDEGMPGVLPDDTLQYNRFVHQYTPPKDTQRVPLRSAVGQYLQAPALHYSLGTRITPGMLRRLEDAGIEEVMTSPQTPRFSPEMVRLRTATKANPDWLSRMTSSYIKDTLETASTRGEDTNILSNPHYVPRLAFGKDFGKQVENTGKF